MPNFARVTDLLTGTSSEHVVDSTSSPLSADVLRSRGSRSAIFVGDRVVHFAELADLIDDRRRELGATPQLVVLHGTNTLDFVVTYLAALDGRHPVIVTATESAAATAGSIFGASIEVAATESAQIRRLEPSRALDWHPDLAAMMSTSGSTGSPKLVRLSLASVTSNALAIAQSLDLGSHDRAITSLPLHYCYGLSVVTSHLAVGGSVVLTDTSVVDPCFWSAVNEHDVTTLAGVPHTFELISRLSRDVLAAPSLRRVTQAGGRMAPETVEVLARVGERHGWKLYVMYGQTEATARMACLSPSFLPGSASSVGSAIPGGALRIDPIEQGEPGAGEIVYAGPNVMMGYASSPTDLQRGHDLDELRTGDIGRFDDDGNLEIVGRLSRFVKLHGKRTDLDALRNELRTRVAETVHVAGDDMGLVVGVVDATASAITEDDAIRATVADLAGVPAGLVCAVRLRELPMTASSKVDAPALIEAARAAGAHRDEAAGTNVTVFDEFEVVFGQRPDPTATFARLGGDSFTYVEMSIRLESILGSLPGDWHLRPLAELEQIRLDQPSPSRLQRWTRLVDTSVLIRAIGILLIVCTHMRVFRLAGGAHALLAVVGYNVARFQLLPQEVPDRARRVVTTIGRIAVPTSVWIGVNLVLAGGYSLGAVLLVNNYTGSANRTEGRWEYWYFEAFVQIMIVLALVFSIGRVRQAERARPFAFALGVLGLTLLFRFEVVNLGGAYNEIFRPHTVACFVALGWCAQRAATVAQRLLVTVLAVVTTLGYFETVGRVDQLDRELRILAAVLALVWIRSVRLPTPVAAVVGKVAAASMWIFLVHWQVWPMFTPWLDDRVAFLLTIAVGTAVWWGVGRASQLVGELRQRRTDGRKTRSHVSSADTAISSNAATPVSA